MEQEWVIERANEQIMETKKIKRLHQQERGSWGKDKGMVGLSEPSGQTGFLSINAPVSSWKWNNKWAFRTLSGLFHAWMFSLNFGVNPLGKQWGMAVESGEEREGRRGRYKERD